MNTAISGLSKSEESTCSASTIRVFFPILQAAFKHDQPRHARELGRQQSVKGEGHIWQEARFYSISQGPRRK